MKTNLNEQSDTEIRYLRFISNTLQIERLREDVCDEFTRKIFDYLEDESLFDAQVFCAFLYHFISKCKLFQPVVERSKNPIDDLRLARFPNEIYFLLDQQIIRFALPSIHPNIFHSVSLEEKLKHLLDNNEPSSKSPQIKIIQPEISGNIGVITYVDIEFTLPRLKVEQKLDIIHFTICALNYLLQRDNPADIYFTPKMSYLESISKSEEFIATHDYLEVITDKLVKVRNSIIINTFNDKEGFGDDLEFDESLPDIKRILQAQNQDPKIEKQWLRENPSVFTKLKAETKEIDVDENLKITLSARQWLIALRFFINHYDLRQVDVTAFARLLAVMNGGKNLQNFRRDLGNERGLITAKTREDAKEVANICRDVGLTKIADEIERAIEKVKTNYL